MKFAHSCPLQNPALLWADATIDLLEKVRAQDHEFEIRAKPVHPVDLLAKVRSPEMLASTTPQTVYADH